MSWAGAKLGGMKQYSVDLRERLLGAIDAGLSQAEASRLFGVGTSTITRWRQQRRETGSLAPKPRPGRRPAIGPDQAAALQRSSRRRTRMPRWPSTARAGTQAHGGAPERGRACRAPSGASASRSKKVLRASEQDPVRRAAWWADAGRV